jgi:hypothetical protein
MLKMKAQINPFKINQLQTPDATRIRRRESLCAASHKEEHCE